MQPTSMPLSSVPAVPDQWAQFGIVGIVAFLFLVAVVYLFLRSDKREANHLVERLKVESARSDQEEKFAVEREGWKTERALIVADFERKLREAVEKQSIDLRSERESHAQMLRTEREANRQHEDLVRKEFTELMDRVSSQQSESADKLRDLLSRFYDRFISPGSRGG